MENASAAHPGQENSNVKTPKLRPCRVEKSNISDVGRHAASQISQRSRIQLTHPQLAFLLHNEAALFPDATRFRWLETQRCKSFFFLAERRTTFFSVNTSSIRPHKSNAHLGPQTRRCNRCMRPSVQDKKLHSTRHLPKCFDPCCELVL